MVTEVFAYHSRDQKGKKKIGLSLYHSNQMLELKRRGSADSDERPVKRERVALEELTEDGPLTQDDVIYFKKQAIWRQMRHYRGEAKRLKSELARAQQALDKLRDQVDVLESWRSQNTAAAPELSAAIAEVKQLADTNADLRAKIAALEALVAQHEGTLLRNELAALKRVFGATSSDDGALPAPLAAGDGAATTDAATDDAGAVPDAVAANGALTDEVERLHLELEQTKAEAQVLKSQLTTNQAELNELSQRVAALELKLALLGENDVKQLAWYQALALENATLKQQIATLETQHQQTLAKLEKLDALPANPNYQAVVDELASVKQQLEKTETDLVRIRTARDDLVAKNAILKSESASAPLHAELVALNKSLSARVSDKAAAVAANADDALLALLLEDQLRLKVKQLISELQEVELAFNDTRKMALAKVEAQASHDATIKKLTVEKTKADQKYFGLMRLKDQIQQENKLLKAQVAKLQDGLRQSQEVERALQEKMAALERQVREFQQVKLAAMAENVKLSEQVARLLKLKDQFSDDIAKARATSDAELMKLRLVRLELQLEQQLVAKLEVKLKHTEQLLRKYKLANPSLVVEDEQEIEGLRSMAKCLVCLKNWKDTAISVCGHVFCHDCTSERLAARLRRCPTCNKGFSANDLLLIHL